MVFPFEKEAAKGDPMPEGLDIPDQLAFQFLANMYARIRVGSLTREQATKEKGSMTYKYSMAKSILEASSAMGKYWADLRKDTEFANIQYKKNPSRATADILSATLDGNAKHTGGNANVVSP